MEYCSAVLPSRYTLARSLMDTLYCRLESKQAENINNSRRRKVRGPGLVSALSDRRIFSNWITVLDCSSDTGDVISATGRDSKPIFKSGGGSKSRRVASLTNKVYAVF